ncbi:MAG TPA: murein biosynthesis integral membrane protein MurJ [Anaerolineales bacterium]|nr:murein biosynthesis integral membrane protein MurJ [Anaerolineales bacterium]
MTHISRSTLIIAVFFGIDKIAALVRQVLMPRVYSTSDLDVFLAANNIPDLLSVLISGGALGVALIPVLSEHLEQGGRTAAWELFSRVLNLAFIITGLLAVILSMFAEWIVGTWIAPGFRPEQIELAAELMRLDLYAIMIFSISGLVMAGLQANQHFLFPAMAPVLYNAGQIFGIIVFSTESEFSIGPITLPAGLGLGIHGLVYGVILGAGLHLLVQVPALLRFGFRWQPGLGLNTPGVRKTLRLLVPRVLTMVCIQWFFLLRDNLASRLGEGSVTGLNYGWFLMQVPETLIGTALAIAILPTLAEEFVRRDDDAFRETINRGIRVMLGLTVPAAAVLAAGIRPVIGIIGLEPHVADLAVISTQVYLAGLAGHALLEIAARSFYARQDARTPMVAAFLNLVLLYSVLAIALYRPFGVAGIAAANSVAFTVEATVLFILLRRKVPGIFRARSTVLRAVAGAAAGAGVVLAVNAVAGSFVSGGFAEILAGLGALAAGGLAALPFIWPEIKLVVKL